MNTCTYNEARRHNVPASYAYSVAQQDDTQTVFGRFPSNGDTYREGAITYTLKIEPDEFMSVTEYGEVQSYSRESDLPDDALVISECDRRSCGFYITAKTWAEFWPQTTDPKARAWLFERYARQIRELIENGYCVVTVTATDHNGQEIASECVGGFDDAAYGAQDVFENCRAMVQHAREKARKERREAVYWRNRGIETVAA